jgi:starch synthase
MRAVLAVASECAPLVKTGGLADVVGALPLALAREGWGLRTLLPGYPGVMAQVAWEGAGEVEERDLFGGPARVRAARLQGLELLILEAPHLFERAGSPYQDLQGRDWPDNPERFAALSWMAARIGVEGFGGWRPEVLHLHDWQAGWAPTYLPILRARRAGGAQGPALPGTLFTVHNIAFQGLAPADRRARLRLPEAGFQLQGFEYYGHLSALKAGLVGADALTTVSPTYAEELRTPEFGMGMQGVIEARADRWTGILNGIDTAVWDPAHDPEVVPFQTARGKAVNRKRLLHEFGCADRGGPLCAVVSRLTPQKGLDLLLDALPALIERGGSLVLLGSGDPGLEGDWLAAAQREPAVSVRLGYDEGLAHRMFAGADAVLVPSRFEPCGLTQLCALRYGAIPVVARTGGLADTVIHANDAALRAGVATGIQFPAPSLRPEDGTRAASVRALTQALVQLTERFEDRPNWAKMRRNALRHPVGWESSAPRYAALYEAIAPAP